MTTARTVVVGSGAAGATLAARLSTDPHRTVTLLEAGTAGETPADLLDGGRLAGAAPGHPANWDFIGEISAGRLAPIARGKILGGSTATNGGYFVRATPADFDRWSEQGGSAWSYQQALPLLRELEHDLDYPESATHGTRGPMPVSRPASAPVSSAFIAAAGELGFPEEPDKNAGTHPGAGPVPSNIVDGRRVNTAEAYLGAAWSHVEVRDSTRALRVVLDGERAIGVDTDHGFIEADEVVLAAGAINTSQILLLSGIGPRLDLERLDITVAADLPVGREFSDHPNLAIEWYTQGSPVDWEAGIGFPTALNCDSADLDPSLKPHPSGDVEILLTAKPLSYLLTGVRHRPETLDVMVALQQHEGRGRLSLRSSDPFEQPRIEYRYLQLAGDTRRMRVAVRTAARLLRTRALANIFAGFVDLSDAVLDDDSALDEWIRSRHGTALHTSGTAPMGSVVDGAGRIRGIAGLRVADTSILPTAPHRGPAATAVFIGELIARRMLEDAASSHPRARRSAQFTHGIEPA